jgi:hypothetical protein
VSEQPAAPARKENVFTNKIGPLPMWAWVAVVAAALVAWRLWSSKNAAAQQQPTTIPSTPADQVPQFVNQTYVTTTPPNTPATSPPTTSPPPPPTPGGFPPPPPRGSFGPLPTNPPPVLQYPPPTGLRATSVGNTTVGLEWTTVPSGTRYPPSYTVAIYNSRGKPMSMTTVSTPDTTGARGTTTVTGLPSRTHLHANVWANGGQQAPKHATVNFTTA